MKFIIETGSGSHTTSSAHLQAFFHGGPLDGQPLYTQKQFIAGTEWDTSKLNERWCTTSYELPEGTEITVKGKGRTGPRGVNVDEVHSIYRLEPTADILDGLLNVGLRRCLIKGRLVLIKDLIAAAKPAVSTEEGF